VPGAGAGTVAGAGVRSAPARRRASLAGSAPARLRLLLSGLAALTVLWGAVAASTVAARAAAAGNVAAVSEPLSLDAQRIYRSLSDADATEAAAFLHGGLEPFFMRRRYLADIARAASVLETATAAAGQSAAGSQLAILSADLPVYAGLVETARAYNRLGLPLGAAYLREASGLMRSRLLPAARELYAQENARLAGADGQATALPYAVFAIAVIVALALWYAQRWLSRQSRRVINPGLLLASVAGLTALIWLISALMVARANLIAARDQGSAPVEALARADIAVLRAHADESLNLIDRSGNDSYQQDFLAQRRRLGPGPGTLLTGAALAARGSPGSRQAAAALRIAPAWFAVHSRVSSLGDSGSYQPAVALAIGTGRSDSGGLFTTLDTTLTSAISADQASFRSAAQAARGDLGGLEAGIIALSLIMAGASAWGVSRRLGEYR
jgi:hypothetical protein